jgi:hypothetical protein
MLVALVASWRSFCVMCAMLVSRYAVTRALVEKVLLLDAPVLARGVSAPVMDVHHYSLDSCDVGTTRISTAPGMFYYISDHSV